MNVKRYLPPAMIILIALSALGNLIKVNGQVKDSAALDDAEMRAIAALGAIRAAEDEGANVLPLINKINDALDLLMKARILYENGNGEESAAKAKESTSISMAIEEEAMDLAISSAARAEVNFRLTIIFSAGAVTAIAIGVLVAWRVFEKRYRLRILKMRPEVSSNES